jgi:hypothetical protein
MIALASLTLLSSGTIAYANHSWGGYHWARTTNPFTLKLGNNVSNIWSPYLSTTSSDWNVSTTLHTTIVPGTNKTPKNCRPTSGRVEVCNASYGNNGWLGIAQVWISGLHITQGTVKLNDTYFNTSSYNKPAWRNLVMCQELAHTFGLDHQDEIFTNANLGTCMDYTNDPNGLLYHQLSNEHPNAHDYEELVTIYSHLDSTTTIGSSLPQLTNNAVDTANPPAWGRVLKQDAHGRPSVYEQDLGHGHKVFTFVVWADHTE